MRAGHGGRRRYVVLILALLSCTLGVLAFPDLWYRKRDALLGEQAHIEPAGQADQEAELHDYKEILVSPDSVWTSINLAYIDMEEVLAGVRNAFEPIIRQVLLEAFGYEPDGVGSDSSAAAKIEENLVYVMDNIMSSAYLVQGNVVSGNLGEMFLSARIYFGKVWLGDEYRTFIYHADTESVIGLLMNNVEYDSNRWISLSESLFLHFRAQLNRLGLADEDLSWYMGGPGVNLSEYPITGPEEMPANPVENDGIYIPPGWSFGLLPAGLPEVCDEIWYIGLK